MKTRHLQEGQCITCSCLCFGILDKMRYDWIPNPANGIVHGFGFGQSDFMWHLRLLPRVKACVLACILTLFVLADSWVGYTCAKV